MKLPSILRTPRHQKFHIEPRYYDPVKEEFREREERILRSLKSEKDKENKDEYTAYTSLRGAFSQRRSSKSSSASFTQMIIMVLLAALIFGYIFYGDLALYIVLGISSVLLYFRITRRS